MIPCPRCGTVNAPSAAACNACGATFAAPPAKAALFKQTMLGMAGGHAAPPAGAPAGPIPPLALGKQTMLGMAPGYAAPPAAPPAAAPPAAPPAAAPAGQSPPFALGKQTMVGMASPFHAQPQIPSGSPAVQAPVAPAHAPQGLQPGAAFKQTLLGVAGPNFGVAQPANPAASAPAPQPSAQPNFRGTMVQGSPMGGQPFSAPSGYAPDPVTQTLQSQSPVEQQAPAQAPADAYAHKRTMMGVAVPGIAPVNPGVAKPISSAPPPPAPAFYEQPIVARAPARRAKRKKVPRGAYWLIGVAGTLMVGAAGLALFWEAPRPITARLVLDSEGREKIELGCSNCPDQTTLHTDSASAVFKAGKALLSLRGPLRIGDNRLVVALERPGMGRDERVELDVPVQYRIRGDLTGLEEAPPKLRIAIEAASGTAVVVDGRATQLDSSGKGTHEIPIGAELEGPEDSVVTLEKRVPYTVTPTGGAPESGEVTLKLGVAPLRIDAPGPRIVVDTEHFMLTGKTAKDGTVSVEGKPITVDVSGRFAQLMNVSSVGETTITVRAALKDHAPRLARVEVKRVESLGDEAAAFSQRAVQNYADLDNPDGRKGTAVALQGRVVESRSENQVTFALLDVTRGCPQAPCFVRLVHGSTVELSTDEQITAYGEVTRAVDGPRTGDRIPEIGTAFVVREGRKRR